MSQCSASDLIAQACQSGFTCRSEPELLALLNQLLCNFASGGAGSFVVDNLSPAAGVIFSGPHGLGRVPSKLRAVTKLVSTDANVNATIGTEINISGWWDLSSAAPEFSLAADATNIYLASNFFTHGPGESDCQILNPSGALVTPSNINNFKLKIYAGI